MGGRPRPLPDHRGGGVIGIIGAGLVRSGRAQGL